jgi:hypothetical protein
MFCCAGLSVGRSVGPQRGLRATYKLESQWRVPGCPPHDECSMHCCRVSDKRLLTPVDPFLVFQSNSAPGETRPTKLEQLLLRFRCLKRPQPLRTKFPPTDLSAQWDRGFSIAL